MVTSLSSRGLRREIFPFPWDHWRLADRDCFGWYMFSCYVFYCVGERSLLYVSLLSVDENKSVYASLVSMDETKSEKASVVWQTTKNTLPTASATWQANKEQNSHSTQTITLQQSQKRKIIKNRWLIAFRFLENIKTSYIINITKHRHTRSSRRPWFNNNILFR